MHSHKRKKALIFESLATNTTRKNGCMFVNNNACHIQKRKKILVLPQAPKKNASKTISPARKYHKRGIKKQDGQEQNKAHKKKRGRVVVPQQHEEIQLDEYHGPNDLTTIKGSKSKYKSKCKSICSWLYRLCFCCCYQQATDTTTQTI